MRKLFSFTFITLNGYLSGKEGDISWHRHGADERLYSAESLRKGNTLMFGRRTFETMASWWPTEAAMKDDPVVAEGMNNAQKIVFSTTLRKPVWNNTLIISDNIVKQVRRLKELPGNDFTLIGSGTILRLFTENGLIDEYQIMIDPVAIGDGIPIFENMKQPLNLMLINVRTFRSGVVLLTYRPLAANK